jgi:hypothetical protein
MKAVNAAFIEVKTAKFTKKIQVTSIQYHNPNLNLVLKVWIPVAFLMRLAMKMTLENFLLSIFFKHGPPTSDAVLAL